MYLETVSIKCFAEQSVISLMQGKAMIVDEACNINLPHQCFVVVGIIELKAKCFHDRKIIIYYGDS